MVEPYLRRLMVHVISIWQVKDPKAAAALGTRPKKFDRFTEIEVHGMPVGGLDRFIEDFKLYLRTNFPNLLLGDQLLLLGEELCLYHTPIPEAQISRMVCKIENHNIGWVGYDSIDKTPL